jgi:hypothetical protein
MQISNYSKTWQFHIKPWSISLSYLYDNCHKQVVTHIRESRRFESIYTLQGKTRPTRHTLSTLGQCMTLDHTYLTWSTYSNPSWGIDRFGWKLLLPTQSTARRLTDSQVCTQFLSEANQWSNRLKSSFYRWQASRLTGPINTSMQSVRLILAHGGQSIGP